jgi:methyl-accepting chemotaxis protein
MKKISFKAKLQLSIFVLIFITTSISFTVVLKSVTNQASEQLMADERRNGRLISELIDNQFEQLNRGIAALLASPGFNALVTTNGIDHDTLIYSLNENLPVVQADMFLLTDEYGVVRARTDMQEAYGDDLSEWAPVKSSTRGKTTKTVWMHQGIAYLTYSCPIESEDDIVGTAIVARQLGRSNANTIKRMLNHDVALVLNETVLTSTFHGEAAANAVAGVAGSSSKPSGNTGIDSYARIHVGNVEHLVLSSPVSNDKNDARFLVFVPTEQVLASFSEIRSRLMFTGAMALALGILFSWIIARNSLKPLKDAVNVLEAVAEGDLTQKVGVETTDEIGRIGTALNEAVNDTRNTLEHVKNSVVSLNNSSESLSKTAEDLSTNASTMLEESQQSTQNMETASNKIQEVVEHTEKISVNADSVAESSSDISTNLQTVSTAVEQMSASMIGISDSTSKMSGSANEVAEVVKTAVESLRQVSSDAMDAEKITVRAAETANVTAVTINELDEMSEKINNIVEVISSIAEQTDLLALNATIEAASAGEAGKGFAVVASEVKELAKRSAQATQEINGQIEAMQEKSREAVDVIKEIVGVTQEVQTTFKRINASVDEQTQAIDRASAGVTEVAMNAQEVSCTVDEAAKAVAEISQNTMEASNGVSNITSSIQELAMDAQEISVGTSKTSEGISAVVARVERVYKAAEVIADNATDTDHTAKESAELASTLGQLVDEFRV